MHHSNTKRPRDLDQPISLLLASTSLLVLTALTVAPLDATVVPFHADVGTDAADWAAYAGEWTAYAFEEDFPAHDGPNGCRSDTGPVTVSWFPTEAVFELDSGNCPILDGTSFRDASDAHLTDHLDTLTVTSDGGIYGFYGFFGSLPPSFRIILDLYDDDDGFVGSVVGPQESDGSGRGVGFLSSVKIHSMLVRTTERGPTILGAFTGIHPAQTTFEDLGRTCQNGVPPNVAATCDLAYTTDPLQVPGVVFSTTQRGPEEEFGSQLAIEGGTVAVAAPKVDSGFGAVFLYEYDSVSSSWQNSQTLGNIGTVHPNFGRRLALQGGLLVIDTWDGGVYLYEADDAGTWSLVDVIDAADHPEIPFSDGLAVSNGTIAVSDPNDNTVYLFERPDGSASWELRTILEADAGVSSFGRGIALHEDVLVVSGYVSGSSEHRIYTYHRSAADPDVWLQVEVIEGLQLDDAQPPLALDGTTLAVVEQDGNQNLRLYEANPDGSWSEVQAIMHVLAVALDDDRLLLARTNSTRGSAAESTYWQLWARDPASSSSWLTVETGLKPPAPLDLPQFRERYALPVALDGDLAVVGRWGVDENEFAHIVAFPLFGDGFEAGDVSGWSATAGEVE